MEGGLRGIGGEIITSSEVEQLAQTGLFPFYFNHITNFPPRKGATSQYPHLISKYIWTKVSKNIFFNFCNIALLRFVIQNFFVKNFSEHENNGSAYSLRIMGNCC